MAAGNNGKAWEKLSGSLPVGSVQALAATLATSKKSLQDTSDPKLNPSKSSSAEDEIPVIDFHKLLDPELSDAESAKLLLACQNWGFFQLINHGVSEEVIQRMMLVIEEFFKLPLEDKMRLKQPPGKVEGYDPRFVFFEEQKLDWADLLFFYTSPLHSRKIEQWKIQEH